MSDNISTNSRGIFYNALEYIKEKYSLKSQQYSVASPFYMLLSTISSIVGQLYSFLHRAEAEHNLTTAEYTHSVLGLARLAGYEPYRGEAARCSLTISPSIDNTLIITPGTSITIGGYPFVLPYSEYPTRIICSPQNPATLTFVQGQYVTYSFTSAGTKLRAYTVVCKAAIDDDINIKVNGVEWTPVSSFYGYGSSDKVCIVRTSISHGIVIVFGDNVHGKAPDVGSTVNVTVIEHSGSAGNVTSQEIEWQSPVYSVEAEGYVQAGDVASLRIESMPSGGADAESIESVRYHALKCDSSQYLLTKNDYIAYLGLYAYIKVLDVTHDDTTPGIINVSYIRNLANEVGDAPEKLFDITDISLPDIDGVDNVKSILENSGKMPLGHYIKTTTMKVRRYAINIMIKAPETYKPIISQGIYTTVGTYLLDHLSTRIPSSGISSAVLNDFPQIESISTVLLSEVNETAHINRYYDKTITKSDGTKTTMRVPMLEDEEIGFDGDDIVPETGEVWLPCGGFTDRLGQRYGIGLTTTNKETSLSSINIFYI